MAAKSMPKGYEATGQSVMYLVRGLGSCLGLWLGGKAMDTLGPRIMYRVSSAVTLLGCSVFALVMVSCPEPSEKRELMIPAEDETRDPSECEDSLGLESSLELPVIG